MKKILGLLFSFLLLLVCCFQAVSANFMPFPVPEHTIEITETGAVTGTDKIVRNGNVYAFTGDVIGTIVVMRSGVVVDGAGYALEGNGTLTGVWLHSVDNVEIKNLHIRNFNCGIQFTYGTTLDGCTDVTVSENTITDNGYGLMLGMMSGNNSILGNTITNNTCGVYINHSPNNVFRNNQLNGNTHSFWVTCETCVQMRYFVNDIDDSNTINGNPIIYWVNQHDKTVPTDAAYVALVNCTNITAQNLELTGNSQGILVVATNNSLITKNHMTNNNYGIMLFAPYEICSTNTITENTITANTKDGINSWNAHNTLVAQNVITGNQENGINFYDSREDTFTDNTITENIENGIKLWGHESNDNMVSGNALTGNHNGLTLSTSCNNTIVGNNITHNSGYGILLDYGLSSFSNNTIYQNNLDNVQQAAYPVDPMFDSIASYFDPPVDHWYSGTTGNYWSNYNGTDIDSDGLGDTPYVINENNQDNYPSVQPHSIPEFPSWAISLILLGATAVILVTKQKLHKQQSYL